MMAKNRSPNGFSCSSSGYSSQSLSEYCESNNQINKTINSNEVIRIYNEKILKNGSHYINGSICDIRRFDRAGSSGVVSEDLILSSAKSSPHSSLNKPSSSSTSLLNKSASCIIRTSTPTDHLIDLDKFNKICKNKTDFLTSGKIRLNPSISTISSTRTTSKQTESTKLSQQTNEVSTQNRSFQFTLNDEKEEKNSRSFIYRITFSLFHLIARIFTCFNIFKTKSSSMPDALSTSFCSLSNDTYNQQIPKIILKNKHRNNQMAIKYYQDTKNKCSEVSGDLFMSSTPIVQQQVNYQLKIVNKGNQGTDGDLLETYDNCPVEKSEPNSPLPFPITSSLITLSTNCNQVDIKQTASNTSFDSDETNYDNDLDMIADQVVVYSNSESASEIDSPITRSSQEKLATSSLESSSSCLNSSSNQAGSTKTTSTPDYQKPFKTPDYPRAFNLTRKKVNNYSNLNKISDFIEDSGDFRAFPKINFNFNPRPISSSFYDDYLCDKEVESYFDNPVYFDCYSNYKKKTISLNVSSNKSYCYANCKASLITTAPIVETYILKPFFIGKMQHNLIGSGIIRQVHGESYC